MEFVVAPRAYWKGYLKLSLVSCPIALFPASSEREKISFHQINKKTGNRIKYRRVDAETEDEVDSSDIVKGYEVGKGQYIEINPEELEAIAIESKRTIEIDEFVPKKEIDELYLNNPYYLVPDGEVGVYHEISITWLAHGFLRVLSPQPRSRSLAGAQPAQSSCTEWR
jgi:DNA end-binding protein Ku